jgi:hypothetical protein
MIMLIRASLDCDRSGNVSISGGFNRTCPNKTVNSIVAEIVDAMSVYECGTKCAHYTCPYTKVKIENKVNNSLFKGYDTMRKFGVL